MKIVGTGLSGLIGRALADRLEQNHEIVRLKRADLSRPDEWSRAIEGSGAVINLSGENIAAKRWTPKQKEELRSSRLRTTEALVNAIAKTSQAPGVLINASAVGIYGPRDSSPLDETAGPGRGFLSEMCQEWETVAKKAEAYGVRVVFLRTGIVLDKEQGALAKMAAPFRWFVGGPLGDGKQYLSWIHLEDEVNAIIHCLKNRSVAGPVNLAAPDPVTMKEFTTVLGRVLKRPSFVPVPGFALRILLGEMSEMLLTGQKAVPTKLLSTGFQFRFPSLEPALRDLLS